MFLHIHQEDKLEAFLDNWEHLENINEIIRHTCPAITVLSLVRKPKDKKDQIRIQIQGNRKKMFK